MAFRFEKGKHIYFLFKNGYTVQDSQLKPRYYLDRHKAEIYLPRGDEIVEYAPVVHGRWIKPTKMGHRSFDIPHCSACEGVPCGVDEKTKYCPNCGAKMVMTAYE